MKNHVSKTKIKCDNCQRNISTPNFKKHFDFCVSNNNKKTLKPYETWLDGNIYRCPSCEFSTDNKNQIIPHYWRLHTVEGQNHKPPAASLKNGRHNSWNRGLTKDTDSRVEKNAAAVSKATRGRKGVPQTEENKRKTSIRMSLHNPGGKAKWYVVAGQKVQGTWERDIAITFENMGIKWYKPKINRDVWRYKINGLEKSYTPDFWLEKFDLYLEVKGFWWGNDKAKMQAVISQHPDKKLIIIEKLEYEKILRGELVW